ncbi:MAG: hypothetical protein IPK82_22400 [Polyangiaceae bacterium]|nr:hypothetical protein [Polyangiaceae bacterium]
MNWNLKQVGRGEVEKAARLAQEDLWACQHPNGTWDFRGDVGPVITAQVLTVLSYLGCLESEMGQSGAAWLAAQQYPDGSFPLYPAAPDGDLGATATAWAALKAAGGPANAVAKAAHFIEQNGGIQAVVSGLAKGDLGAIFAAMVGLIPPEMLPELPLVPLALSPVRRLLDRVLNGYLLNLFFELRLITHALKAGGPGRKTPPKAIVDAVVETYRHYQNPNGSLNELTMQTAMLVATLWSAGHSLEDDRVARGVAWLKAQAQPTPEGITWSTFSSETWATTHAAHALLLSGVSAGDGRIIKALDWLMDAQCHEEQSHRLNRGRHAVRTGGWAYQKTNVRLPDTDDTAVVLDLMGHALKQRSDLPTGFYHRLQKSHAQGLTWLLGMQNPDGGWAAFTKGHPSKKPGPGPTGAFSTPRLVEIPNFIRDLPMTVSDPSTEGLSGRVLSALGQAGLNASRLEVQKAVRFLERQQCDFGGFWGRWLVNYLPTTACVLLGLTAVDADISQPWVEKAANWICSKQRADGGFGEDGQSYASPLRAGEAPNSMPGLTGLLVWALTTSQKGNPQVVEKAARYLVDTQRADGTWPHENWLATYLPPRMFYMYPGSARFYPLTALGRLLQGSFGPRR